MKTKLIELIDFEKVNTLLEGFNKTTGFVTTIIDLDGNVLSKSDWRQMCTDFHRSHPETAQKCRIHDTELSNKMAEGENYHFYKCLNGLICVAVPLIIKGEHIANLFSGQFFFEEPDRNFFKKQAKKYGFDEKRYLEALEKVPVFSKEKVQVAMNFLLNMTQFISEMTLQKLEQTELNNELKESEERFKALLNASFGGIAIHDKGIILECNQGLSEITGYSYDELIGMDSLLLISPETRDLVMNNILTGYEKPYEAIGLRKNGEIYPIRLEARNVPYKGKTVRTVEIRDITETKLAEEALRQSEDRFKKLSSFSFEGIIIHNNAIVIDVNQSTLNLLGYERNEIVGKSLFTVIHPDYHEITKVNLSKEIAAPFQIVITRKDGSTFDAEVEDRNISYNNEHFSVARIRNITERKRAKKIQHLQYRIARATIATRSLNELFDSFKNELNSIIDAKNFLIALYNEETGMLSANVDIDEKDEIKVWPMKKSLTGYVIKQNRPVLLRKNEILQLHEEGIIELIGTTAEAWLGVPLKVEDKIYGAVVVQNYDNPDVFDQTSIEIMELVAHELSIFIDRQRIEEKANKLLRAIEQSSVSVVITNKEGLIEYTNPFFTQSTGYSFEEAKGKNPSILKSGEHSTSFYKELWNTILSGNKWDGEILNKKKNGELYWEKVVISPIVNNEGVITNFVAIKEDITLRKDMEEHIRQQSLLRKLLMEISSDFINIPFHKVDEAVNKALQKMAQFVNADRAYTFNYNWEKDVCDNIYEWCAEGISPEIDNLQDVPLSMMQDWVEAHRKGKPMYVPDVFSLPRGAIREILEPQGIKSLLTFPMMNEDHCIGFVGFDSVRNHHHYTDTELQLLKLFAQLLTNVALRRQMVNDLVVAKEKAEESDRLKSAFLANMSHEIRTPMNGILGFTELLLEPDLTSEEKEGFIRIIHQSGQRMLNTVNDIVEISKIEAGMIQVVEKETDVNQRIEELTRFFRTEAENKGLKLILDKLLPLEIKNVITDQNKLDSIISNLIKNAIKYTDTGTINVGCVIKKDTEPAEVEFYVKDTGIGITKNRQKAIFNRFEQADIADTRAFQGSGLGLAISKSYVEMLGGKIWVESQEGIGSTFYFTLPYNANPLEETVVQQFEISDKTDLVKKLKILIAEDDEVSEMLMFQMIKMVGNEILKARTGIEAVEVCKKNPDIDLVLMDIKMPGMDGYEATKQIREFNNEVVIIAQTAYGLTGDREKAIEAGCNDYIAKPINKTKLQTLIQKYFGE